MTNFESPAKNCILSIYFITTLHKMDSLSTFEDQNLNFATLVSLWKSPHHSLPTGFCQTKTSKMTSKQRGHMLTFTECGFNRFIWSWQSSATYFFDYFSSFMLQDNGYYQCWLTLHEQTPMCVLTCHQTWQLLLPFMRSFDPISHAVSKMEWAAKLLAGTLMSWNFRTEILHEPVLSPREWPCKTAFQNDAPIKKNSGFM